MIYFALSLWRGRMAGDNPWRATGLEWTTASPPPRENFAQAPVVDSAPYDYHPAHAEPTERRRDPGRDDQPGRPEDPR